MAAAICALLALYLLTLSAALPSSLRHRRTGVTGSSSVDFVDQCTASLLSSNTIDDHFISQDEFSQFLSDYCVESGVCEAGTEMDFQSLNVELQLAFVLFICNQEEEMDRKACLEELNSKGGSFGYDLNVEELEVLNNEIQELCTVAYLQASRSGLLPPTIGKNMACFPFEDRKCCLLTCSFFLSNP